MNGSLDDFALLKPTVATVEAWHDALVRDRQMDPDTARLRKTALRRIWDARPDEATDDAGWMLEHLDELFQHLVAKGTAEATARTYRSRATSALTDFLRNHAHPELRRLEAGRKRSRPRPTWPLGDQRGGELRLDGNRVFRYELPQSFSRRDLRRVTLHLLAQVQDLDARGNEDSVQQSLEQLLLPVPASRKDPHDE